MAISTYVTHGLLNAWQHYMKANAWHFNSIDGAGTQAPLADPGDVLYVQPERDIIAEGIVNALSMASRYLGFFHRPVYVRETIPFTSGWPGTYGAMVRARWRHIQAVGRRATQLLGDGNTAIVYSDEDGDGVDDTATITITDAAIASISDPTEIQAFFRTADSLAPVEADERWQIEPLRVEISGTTATLTGHRSLFVSPALWRLPYRSPNYNSSSKNSGTTTDAANFITNVAIYRVYPDSAGAVRFHMTSARNCATCAVDYCDGTATIQDAENGYLRVCSDCATGVCVGYTKAVEIHYLAGYPLDAITGQPDSALTIAILRLANTLMSYEPQDTKDALSRQWLHDFELMPAAELAPDVINNPFGLRRGQIAAFRTLKNYRAVRASAMVYGNVAHG
jgi:hypothetical protein